MKTFNNYSIENVWKRLVWYFAFIHENAFNKIFNPSSDPARYVLLNLICEMKNITATTGMTEKEVMKAHDVYLKFAADYSKGKGRIAINDIDSFVNEYVKYYSMYNE